VGGELTSGSGLKERVDKAGVVGTEDVKSVTVAVSLESWRVWARVRDPAVEGREEAAG
jgi:hypothetical protein